MFSKSLTAITSFWKWENIDRPCHSKDTGGIAEVYKKTVAVTKDIVVGDIMKSFHETLLKSKSSRNPKKKIMLQNSKVIPTTTTNKFCRLTMHKHISVNYKMRLWVQFGLKEL